MRGGCYFNKSVETILIITIRQKSHFNAHPCFNNVLHVLIKF